MPARAKDLEPRSSDSKRSDPMTLEILSQDWAWKVRETVAKNPSTPDEVVRSLAEDGDQSVKKAAATRLER